MTDGVSIRINGEERVYSRDAFPETLSVLIEQLGLDSAMVVAEVNGDIVGRADFGGHALRSGDVVELVRFVGGG